MKHLAQIKGHHFLLIGLLALGLTGLVEGSSAGVAKSRLEQARENLRISQATEARIARDLEELKRSGQASPEILDEYETYLNRVRAMLIENRKLVRELEARYERSAPPDEPPGGPTSRDSDSAQDMRLPHEKANDDVAALDRELDDALAAFDEMLLKEMDEINRRASDKMRDLAEEAAAAARRLRQKGIALDTSSPESTSDAEEEKDGAMPPGKGSEGSESGEGTRTVEEGGSDSQVATSGDRQPDAGERGKGMSAGKKPATRSGGHDDDIVARQLREAAEKETDPELKEKLWKEYEDYKRGDTR